MRREVMRVTPDDLPELIGGLVEAPDVPQGRRPIAPYFDVIRVDPKGGVKSVHRRRDEVFNKK